MVSDNDRHDTSLQQSSRTFDVHAVKLPAPRIPATMQHITMVTYRNVNNGAMASTA